MKKQRPEQITKKISEIVRIEFDSPEAKEILELLTENEEKLCVGCGCTLPDNLTTRCYDCWDDIYFPA